MQNQVEKAKFARVREMLARVLCLMMDGKQEPMPDDSSEAGAHGGRKCGASTDCVLAQG